MYVFLKNFKGIKRVDNYIRTQQQIAAEAARAHASGDLEEEETYNIMRSRQKENLELLKVVERIVAHRTRVEDGAVIPEYFCKWHSQNYDAATWESEFRSVQCLPAFTDSLYQSTTRSNTSPGKKLKTSGSASRTKCSLTARRNTPSTIAPNLRVSRGTPRTLPLLATS